MTSVERPVLLSGRLADPSRADEAVVTAKFVQTYGFGVGDVVTLRLYSPETVDAANLAVAELPAEPDGPVVRVRVVGVIRSHLVADEPGTTGTLIPSAGLYAAYPGSVLGASGAGLVVAAVRLRGGEADLPTFRAGLARVTGQPDSGVESITERTGHTRDVVRFDAGALLAFGLAALLAALFLVGQSVARYTAVAVTDLHPLRAVGMTPSQSAMAAAAGPVLAAAAGATLGVGAAILASGWMPYGGAVLLEPNPGIDADWMVLAPAWVVVVGLVFAGATSAAWLARDATGSSAAPRRSAIARAVARAGLPAPVLLGVRFALEPGRGRGAVPVRPALLGAVTGVLGVLAAFTFAAGVADAVEHPERFGHTADLVAYLGEHAEPVLAAFAADPDVVGVLDLRTASARSGEASVVVLNYDPVGAAVPVVLTEGRLPETDEEVVLGPTSAGQLGVRTGGTVTFTGDAGSHTFRVTGLGFLPRESYDYGVGAWVTPSGYDSLFTGTDARGAVLALRPGIDLVVVVPRLQRAAASVAGGQSVPLFPPPPPARLAEIQSVQLLPVVLAGFLALLAVGAVGHALTTAVRRRCHDVAVLRALVAAGLAVFVVAVYLVVVVGLARPPVGAERDILLASVAAALVVAMLTLPVRDRLVDLGRSIVGREGRSATNVVGSFSARMSRAVPLDELLLQLAESLHAALGPAGAEVWVGQDGVLTRTVSVPHRPSRRLMLSEHERIVVGRARIGGKRWSSMWLPDLVSDGQSPDGLLRVAPAAHLGELLGLLVVRRPPGSVAFSDEEDVALVELARQVGLALHNVRLDSALQASLAELQQRNVELQASRLRIVTAADESRRVIERDLHDGAQQHLAALAIKLGLARQLLDSAPSVVAAQLEELRADVRTTIDAVRELAHGIYPPLLRQQGLGAALHTAAARSPLPCAVTVDLPGRYPVEVETAVYFCCLEAIHNAGKYAGKDASITVRVDHEGSRLRFTVRDDGAGFEIGPDGVDNGHGFLNMRDRLGAIGGSLEVTSAPGSGATVRGTVPATPVEAGT